MGLAMAPERKARKDRQRTDFFLQKRLFGEAQPKKYQLHLVGFEEKAGYNDALHIAYPTSYRWLGYPKGWTPELREKIRERDAHTCQLCGCTNTKKANSYNDYSEAVLDVHHIDYNRYNLDERNLITLCHGCHSKTNSNRTAWRMLFVEKIILVYGGKNDKHVKDHVL